MHRWVCRFGAVGLLLVAGLLGCNTGGDGKKDKDASDDEKQVKAQFEKLKSALDKRDPDKIWALLDDDSQKDAEKAAEHIKAEFAKADDAKKAEMKKKYIFAGTEKEKLETPDNLDLAALTGKTVLKTAPFHDKYDPIEEADVEKVAIKGEKATVSWKNKESEKGEVIMFKQKGEWRAHLMTPRGSGK
jgi:hypothetical protein